MATLFVDSKKEVRTQALGLFWRAIFGNLIFQNWNL